MKKGLRTLDDFDTENSGSLSRKLSSGKKVSGFKGKRVLLRSDLNSEIRNGRAVISDRIIESAKTISELKKKGARVIVLAHQGRKGGDDFTSLREHSNLLNRYVKIKFVDGVVGTKALRAIDSLKNGDAILLDNVRKIDDEVDFGKGRNKIAEFFRGKFDIYVNDAFSVCHRKHASVVLLPRLVKERAVGRLMERELESLERVRGRNCLFILGGSKTDNILLLGKGRKVLATGVFGQLCMIAKGCNLGVQNRFLKDKLSIVPKLKRVVSNVRTARDVALKVNGKRKEVMIKNCPFKEQIFDIGHFTVEEYVKEIKKAGAVFMKGTAGYCEEQQFCYGTSELLKAIAKSSAHKVLSGGHLSTALKKFGISKKKFDYVSLSGGATVNYIAGKRLPGLEVLKK